MWSGRELAELVAIGYLDSLFPEKVASSPSCALRRISKCFHAKPSKCGTNISGIRGLREAIFRASENDRAKAALMITAPHTHWQPNYPVIVRGTTGRYLSRPSSVDPQALYMPISFVFSERGPLAYEWVDQTISFEEGELMHVYGVIAAVNELVWRHGWPLGLSLNFRFKHLFSEALVPSVEYTKEGEEDLDVSADIWQLGEFLGLHNRDEYAQVGWHAYSDMSYCLDRNGLRTLRKIRKLTKQLDEGELKSLYVSIQEHLLNVKVNE